MVADESERHDDDGAHATLGELLCERAGVLNLGIEGIMTLGAMVGWLAVHLGADLWAGVALAALAGMTMGLLLGLLTIPLGLSQHVTGIGVTLLSTSIAYYTYRVLLPNVSTPPRIEPFPPLAGTWLADLPFVGPVLAQQTGKNDQPVLLNADELTYDETLGVVTASGACAREAGGAGRARASPAAPSGPAPGDPTPRSSKS